ncbi:MAG: hydrogenase iron-sulfur subunit [Promethearchaeota archaeon]
MFTSDPVLPKHPDISGIILTEKEITISDDKTIFVDDETYTLDLIIINGTPIPNKDLRDLRKELDFSLDDEGFMSKETLASGIFGVGSVLGPMKYDDIVISANEIALEILELLSNDFLETELSCIDIDHDKCGLCKICIRNCPYNAISLDGERIKIDIFKCKGCGTCVSVCPTKALEMNLESSKKILKTIDILSKYPYTPKLLAFCCKSCGYAAADDAGLKRFQYHPNVFIIPVACTGRVDGSFITRAIERGFKGVYVLGCKQDACRYIDGITKVGRKVKLLRDLISPDEGLTIMVESLSAVEGKKFANLVNSTVYRMQEES